VRKTKRNDLEIAIHNLKVDIKKLSRRQRKELLSWFRWFTVAMILVAIMLAMFWGALTKPTARDTYEATKWQKYQAEMQK